MNEFEQRLQRVPTKKAPPDWRAEILAAAESASPVPRTVSMSRRFNAWLYSVLWPHPKAWAGLAAVWLIILGLHISQRDDAPARLEKPASPSPELMAELRQQQAMFAELLGAYEVRDADRPKPPVSRPHAQYIQTMTV